MFRAAILLVVAFGAQAQTPAIMPQPLANYDALKRALGLTDFQVRQLQTLQQTRQAAAQAIYRQISDKQKQIGDALNSGSMDATTIGQLEIDMANLRKQIGSGESLRDQALAILSETQKAKLADLQNAMLLQRAANEGSG